MPLIIEPERACDTAAIRNVVRRAFHHHQSVADLVELIRVSPQYLAELALVARLDGDIVGFVMISGAQLVQEDRTRHDVLTLSPLAVDPGHEGRGIGSALVRRALAAADATRAPLVTLEGSPRFYGRLHFRRAHEFGVTIDLPEWAPREAAQVYPLSAYEPTIRGRLVYPPAFAAIGS